MESPRPPPPQPPERGGPTPSTKQADIAPAPTATNAGTRQTNSMHKTSRNRPSPSATTAGTRRTNSEHKTSRNRPSRSATHATTRRSNSMHKTSRNRPVPFRHTRRSGAEQTPCTKRADIAPAPSATHATTRRTNSMHKTSRNRPGPFRHTRHNAAEQLHAQNKPISPRPLPPHTPQRGEPTPCTKQAGIAPAPTATNAGTRQSNGLANLNGIAPSPLRHNRRNAADQLHAQNEPESRTLNELAPRVGFEPTTNRLTADPLYRLSYRGARQNVPCPNRRQALERNGHPPV